MADESLLKAVSEETKRLVWNKGRIIPGRDSDMWRKDVNGHSLRYEDHGNTDSEYGWEIDHIHPKKHGGTLEIDNLQPLYWKTNRIKSDTLPTTSLPPKRVIVIRTRKKQ